ncbi:MAG: (Fe-S)-binding protein [Candidatus Thorarchaeota archaeon]
MSEEEAFEFVKGTLKEEGIVPHDIHEIEIIKNIEKCINCGLCINSCPVVLSVGLNRFSGPRSIAVELSRSAPEFWTTADVIFLCTGCGTCREVCPNNVNIPEIVTIIRSRIFKQRPELVPKGLMEQDAIINEHNLAFEPWEDLYEKEESALMRLERYGLVAFDDPVKTSAEVLFYPGCQAEERAQEVKGAAKVILEYFGIDYTVLKDLTCCGLPSTLIGNQEKANELASIMKQKIKEIGIKKIVTTCAGCTSHLTDSSVRYNWGIDVYHMLEFLTDEIGLEKVSKALSLNTSEKSILVTVHDPCHLIKHTSRQVMDYAVTLLKEIPGVDLSESTLHDSCCGGGGLVARHAPDVSKKIVRENIDAIEKTGADRVVTPCPLCTAQLEDSLYRAGKSVEVDDLTVFIAQKLIKPE